MKRTVMVPKEWKQEPCPGCGRLLLTKPGETQHENPQCPAFLLTMLGLKATETGVKVHVVLEPVKEPAS